MASKQQWLTRLQNELVSSPLVANTIFGFILVGLEKLAEEEFACPCRPRWNGPFVFAFFVLPAIMSFISMMIILRFRRNSPRKTTVILSSFVPGVVWVTLTFFDGRYLVCGVSNWEGRYVLMNSGSSQKWCEPLIDGSLTPRQLLLLSKEWFSTSQGIGIVLLILICVGLMVYMIRESKQEEVEMQDADGAELNALGENSQPTPTY